MFLFIVACCVAYLIFGFATLGLVTLRVKESPPGDVGTVVVVLWPLWAILLIVAYFVDAVCKFGWWILNR